MWCVPHLLENMPEHQGNVQGKVLVINCIPDLSTLQRDLTFVYKSLLNREVLRYGLLYYDELCAITGKLCFVSGLITSPWR